MRMLDHVPVRPNFIGGLPAALHQVLLPWDIAGPESMVAFRLRCEAGRYPIQDFRWRQDVFLTRGGDAPVVRTLRQLAASKLAAFCLATATVANDQAMGNVAGGMLRGLTGPAEVHCHVTAGFVAFVNAKHLFHFSYQRYLINQIRENFGLEHTPIRLVVRERGSGEVGAKDV